MVASSRLTTIQLSLQPYLLINLYWGALTEEGDGCIRCSYIKKFMNQFLLFTVGPLLLSVKGIIDLAQMPPTILLPHPGGTGTPTLERIAYLPGAQPPFPSRAFNPTSISPGEDPSLTRPHIPCSFNSLATISMFHQTSAMHWNELAEVSSAVQSQITLSLTGVLVGLTLEPSKKECDAVE